MSETGLAAEMAEIGRRARAAARILASAPTEAKNRALTEAAAALLAHRDEILKINAAEVATGAANGLTASFLDRLKLDKDRIGAIASALHDIVALNDPVGTTIAEWDVPSGLHISRVRTPLGVIGVIFESRPNVTADAGALCLKAGNAVILRPGSDSYQTSRAIHACLVEGLERAGLPADAIQMVPTTDRAAVGELLGGLGGNVDVIVPRGGKGLVARVQAEARVPVFAHLEGICHVYVDKAADRDMAVAVTLNAKMRRTSICGAAETLLVHRDVAKTHLLPILEALDAAGCEIRGDRDVCALFPKAIPATAKDWDTEYGEPIISVAVVDDIDAAIDHVETHSSHHTEAIITDDRAARDRFFARIDSAILMHNASTQFADGGEFGMGAEIGIATGKMHARGPVGLEQLTSFKYLVEGKGTTRP